MEETRSAISSIVAMNGEQLYLPFGLGCSSKNICALATSSTCTIPVRDTSNKGCLSISPECNFHLLIFIYLIKKIKTATRLTRAPAYAGSGKWSHHVVYCTQPYPVLHKRLFPELEPVTFQSHNNNFTSCVKVT